MSGFAGFVALDATLDKTVVSKTSSGVPTDADALPTYRVYAPSGFLLSGSLSYKDTGTITNCPPANPTVYTSQGHNLSVGQKVTISGIGGNTGANGTYDVTVVTSNTFTVAVDTSAGGAYTSGGSWHATGLYDFSITPAVAQNFSSGTVYSVVVYAKFSSVVEIVEGFEFQVT